MLPAQTRLMTYPWRGHIFILRARSLAQHGRTGCWSREVLWAALSSERSRSHDACVLKTDFMARQTTIHLQDNPLLT